MVDPQFAVMDFFDRAQHHLGRRVLAQHAPGAGEDGAVERGLVARAAEDQRARDAADQQGRQEVERTLAVQVEIGRLLGMSERPSEKQLRELAEAWRPHRGAAAVLAWHSYNSVGTAL